MRQYTAQEYYKLVEKFNNSTFQSWQKTEADIISKVKNSKNKTFIDLGAGYGRVLKLLAKISRNVIAIEINSDMLSELKNRARQYKNTDVLQGDIQNLFNILQRRSIQDPVLLLLQNTLGTIEGDYRKVLSQMKKVTIQYRGGIIISLLRQEALKDFGMELYGSISPMTGKPDLERTDFETGLFVSKTGYKSKWWTSNELEEIKRNFGGEVINEIRTKTFYILHISLL